MSFITLVPPIYYNILQYGADPTGAGDSTSAIANAMSAANAAGGGIVFCPAGLYISGNQTLYQGVSLLGAGVGATTIKLKNGANTDLFSAQTSSINLSAALGSGIAGTLFNFSIQGMTLDGNQFHQSSGPSYPLRFYGYNFTLRDLEVSNGYSGGALIDWCGPSLIAQPSDEMESLIDSVKFHTNNGMGLQLGGPHDSKMRDCLSWGNNSHDFHFAPNATGMLVTNCHGYGVANTAGVCIWLIESPSCQFTNCVAEGSYYCNVAILNSNTSWTGGDIYGAITTAPNQVGLQLGQIAGQTPFPGQIFQSGGVTIAAGVSQCMIQTLIISCKLAAINAALESNNIILANIFQSVGVAVVANQLSTTDMYIITVRGLTSDGSLGTSGGFNIPSNGTLKALTVNDVTNGQVFFVDNAGNVFIKGGYNTSSSFYFTASATPVALANNGTISVRGKGRIVVAPTSNVTGVIMQTGFNGQVSTVINASNFTITCAASGTSNMADGTSAIIAPNRCMFMIYDEVTSLWYRT
jgi:hypothetical protein